MSSPERTTGNVAGPGDGAARPNEAGATSVSDARGAGDWSRGAGTTGGNGRRAEVRRLRDGAPVSPAEVGLAAGLRQLLRSPAVVLVAVIRLYQRTISPMLGPTCRYYPSCSRYAVGAISTHGALKGTLLTARRLSRCTPFHAGGLDPVPPRGTWRPRIEPDGRVRP